MKNKHTVKIQKDGDESTIMLASLNVWLRNGWTLVDDGSSESRQVAAQQLSLDHEHKE